MLSGNKPLHDSVMTLTTIHVISLDMIIMHIGLQNRMLLSWANLIIMIDKTSQQYSVTIRSQENVPDILISVVCHLGHRGMS